jgi:hypothetical protein
MQWHIVASFATFIFAVCLAVTAIVPSFLPGIYTLIIDDRITLAVPYLLLLALGGSLFSLWYFLCIGNRKK